MNTFLPDSNPVSQKYPMINSRYLDTEENNLSAFQSFLNLQGNPSALYGEKITNNPETLILAKLKYGGF